MTVEIQNYKLDQEAFNNILNEIGEKYARVKMLEIEVEQLRDQNKELTQKLLRIQSTLQEKGII